MSVRFKTLCWAVATATILPVIAGGCVFTYFTGDSELGVATSAVKTAEDGGGAVSTLHANYGCGLMPDICVGGHDADGNPIYITVQAQMDQYWQNRIAADEARPHPPQYEQVELGLDDAGHSDADLADFKDRIEQFISWLPPNVPVLWDNIPEMSPSSAAHRELINQALVDAAAETPNLYIVDLHSAFADHWPDWFVADGVHYDGRGRYESARVNCEALNAIAFTTADCDPQGLDPGVTTNPLVSTAPRRSGPTARPA